MLLPLVLLLAVTQSPVQGAVAPSFQELEESLESYTRGVELLKSLRTRLTDAEQKVSVLLKDVDGNDVLADGEAANTDDNLSF